MSGPTVFDIARMALHEAGRPDLADRLPGRNGTVLVGGPWGFTATEDVDDWPVLCRAVHLANSSPAGRTGPGSWEWDDADHLLRGLMFARSQGWRDDLVALTRGVTP